MSTLGTAQKPDYTPNTTSSIEMKSADKGIEFASQAATLPNVGASFNTACNQLERVERLVHQLEVNSLALVPYGYRQPRATPEFRMNKVVTGLAIAMSFIAPLLSVAVYVHYEYRQMPSERIEIIEKSQSIGKLAPEEKKDAEVISRLASALDSSAKRFNQLKSNVDEQNRLLRMMTAEAHTSFVRKGTSESKRIPVSTVTPERNGTSNLVRSIKPIESALPHRSADGSIDYWLIPHGPSLEAPTRVVMLGSTADGVFVYNMGDGKNYRLTRGGNWYLQSQPPGAK